MRRLTWAFSVHLCLTSKNYHQREGTRLHSHIDIWPQRQKCTYVPSEDSDQPEHSRRLIRIFIDRILDSQGCKVFSCWQRRLWSDCSNAQADLSLRWSHMSKGTFPHVSVYIYIFHITLSVDTQLWQPGFVTFSAVTIFNSLRNLLFIWTVYRVY